MSKRLSIDAVASFVDAADMLGETVHRLAPLTGLRGVAAYSVLIAHGISVSFTFGGANGFAPFASRLAYFGMSLLFVLSGFVIYFNYAESFTRDPLGRAAYNFFVARFAPALPALCRQHFERAARAAA